MPQVTPTWLPTVLPRRVSHRQWQKPLTVGQGGRGTCWAFGGAAALEGAYARVGVDVKLSEHYIFHLVKAHENQAQGNINDSLMGFGGGAGVVRLMRHFGVPAAPLAPYIDSGPLKMLADSIPQTGKALTEAGGGSKEQADWMEYDLRNIPASARWSASYRVATYGTVPATVDALRGAIAAGHDVTVDVWDRINNGGHVLLLIGYDDDSKVFEIKNPQDTPGFGTMLYTGDSQFDLQVGTAFFVASVAPVAPQWAAMWIGRWEMDHDGWLGRLTIRRFTNIQVEATDLPGPSGPIPIGTWYGADGRFETVTGGFTDGGRGLVVTIAGQKFELWVHGRDPWRASGRCWWDGQTFGVVLSRGPTLGAGSGFDRDEMIGLWDIVHDGWRGELRIGAEPFYVQADDGIVRGVTIAPSTVPHHVNASIGFSSPPQPFAILAHTREDGVLGGTTTWANQTWPVEGRMSSNLYTVAENGALRWYRHRGRARRTAEWDGPEIVGSGWAGFSNVFGGNDGVIYAVRPDGQLLWYFHDGRNTGTSNWQGPTEVGTGRRAFRKILVGDGGTIYAVTAKGRLLWYRHFGATRWIGALARSDRSWQQLGSVYRSRGWTGRLLRTGSAQMGRSTGTAARRCRPGVPNLARPGTRRRRMAAISGHLGSR